MKFSTRQQGFTGLEIVVVLAALGLISLAAFTVYENRKEAVQKTELSPRSSLTAPEIKTSADLDSAIKVMEGADFEASSQADLKVIEQESSGF